MELSVRNRNLSDTARRVVEIGRAKLAEIWRSRHKRRALLVKETAALGERRFVAVVQFEQQRFLIGASSGAITLIATLPDAERSGEEG